MIVGRKGKTFLLCRLFLPLPPGEGRGEGSDFLHNCKQHPFEIFEYIHIAESKDMDTSLRQEHRSGFILLLTFLCVMLSTIKFYTEIVVMTIKIEDVGPDRVLTSEFESQQLTAAENAPEKLFCVGLIFAQPACEIEKFRVQRGFHAALTLALSRREREYVPG
jgi:hypothetical protein